MALSSGGDRNKRRRRRRSEQARAVPERRLPPRRTTLTRTTEIVASVGVFAAALALIALVWISELRSVAAFHNEIQARVEATVSGQALVLATEVRRELLGVEQSLKLLKQAFQANADHFDIQAWAAQMPALTDVTDEVFVADNEYIIEQDTNKASVGLGLGANLGDIDSPVTERNESEQLVIGPTSERVPERQHVALLVMRLDHPGGWIVGATYKTDALSRLYSEASLGLSGMAALINTHLGQIEVISGPAAANPNYDIAKTPMFEALNSRPDGTWVGASAPDGVERIHGFHRVPGRDLAVVVAVSTEQAMQPVETWAGWSRALALGATLVILAAAGVVIAGIWTFRTTRRLRQGLERERTMLDSTQLELSDTRSRLESRTSQVNAMFAGVGEGTVLLDPELRMTEWNQNFPSLFGVSPQLLQPGLPFDEILRIQAREGDFGPLDDIEGEVGRRLAHLREGAMTGAIYAGPGGRTLAISGGSLPGGGLIVIMRGVRPDELTSDGSVRPEAMPAFEQSPIENA
jgi:PAS domain-containing protein